ncbi:hypothetical protein [Lentzea xinjiangensis]|nr:hypothetical protein [Lentzea xinjiangensis]
MAPLCKADIVRRVLLGSGGNLRLPALLLLLVAAPAAVLALTTWDS